MSQHDFRFWRWSHFLALLVTLAFAALLLIPLSAAAKGGGNAKGKVLIVNQKNGTVDFGDPCPSPRTSAKYLDVQAAVDCAMAGDTIKIRPGAYESNWDPGAEEAPDSVQVTKSLNLIGSGINRTVLKNGGVGIGPNAISGDRTVVRISDMTLAFDVVNQPGEGTGGAILDVGEGARVYARRLLLSAVSGIPLAYWVGAVGNKGYLELDEVQIVGNTVVWRGAAVGTGPDSYTRIKRSAIVNNVSQTGDGGAIYNAGKMDIFKSLVTANRGGGILNDGTIKLRGSVVELNQGFDCIGCP